MGLVQISVEEENKVLRTILSLKDKLADASGQQVQVCSDTCPVKAGMWTSGTLQSLSPSRETCAVVKGLRAGAGKLRSSDCMAEE